MTAQEFEASRAAGDQDGSGSGGDGAVNGHESDGALPDQPDRAFFNEPAISEQSGVPEAVAAPF
jgi:hypothetical protein